VAHPLTPYSPAYFYPEPGSGLFTYAADWLPALSPERGAANFQSGDLPLPAEWGREQGLELAELLRFYRQPARYFLNRRLKVWFELEEATIEDSEPFELDGLQHYQLKALLLDAHLTEGGERGPSPPAATLRPAAAGLQLAAGGDRRRDGQAGGAAASLTGTNRRWRSTSPWPRGSFRAG
jgi:exonuclease V gamma subunit